MIIPSGTAYFMIFYQLYFPLPGADMRVGSNQDVHFEYV